MMSDSIMHDSVYVHTFQQHVIKFIKCTSESPLKKKNFYFYDESQPNTKAEKKITKYYTPQ
jgi:hypothetical protein